MRLLTASALLLSLALVGCGSTDEHDLVSDPEATSPTASPTVGSYPGFAPTDYTYLLRVQCFCAFAGSPVRVTVANAEVVGALFAQDDGGREETHAGDEAPTSLWLTINDVIGKANNTTAARVTVDWPTGQEYPNSVFVDQDKNMADEEVGYTISDVRVR